MKFQSKKDWWLTIIVWGSMLFVIGSSVIALITEPPGIGELIIVLLSAFLLPIFVLWMWLTTYYILDEHHLVIRYGPFRKKILLETIRSVRKTTNPLSSPALSLKRLEISYGKYDSVLISPIDRDEFIKILSEHCPRIIVR